jgi:hypothetical protein
MNKDNLLELVHGFNAGIVQSIIGHPIDTYKTWTQMRHIEKISLKSLYRGFTYPAYTNGIINGIVFHAYEYIKKDYGMILGGIYAGVITGLLSSYFEYEKVRAQLKLQHNFRKIIIFTTVLREIPACTFYYPVYDNLKLKGMSPFLSGGIAGVTCWLSSYWLDVINTHIINGYTLKYVIKTLSFHDYFRGLSLILPRAFVINAVGYYFYDLSKTYIK